MKIDEIFDRDEHKQRLAAAMKQLQQQYPTRTVDPAKEQARAESRKRAEAEWAHRDNVVMPVVAQIAKKYKGDQFEQFKAEVVRTLKPEDLKILGDLQTAWKIANPEQAEISRSSWDQYAQERKGQRWTGD